MSAPHAKSVLFALALASAPAAGGCGRTTDARPQWLVEVSTDAPVPQLGDRVLVELLLAGGASACTGCRRLFGVEGPMGWPLSFGIPDPGAGVFFLRVRLFRSDHSDAGGGPAGGLPIDVLAALPPSEGDVRRVSVALSAACAGVTADVAQGLTCDAGSGMVASGTLVPRTLADTGSEPDLVTGAFAEASSAPCAAPAPTAMTCVPGGLFARGDSAHDLVGVGDLLATPERLVRVSPFAIDQTEMTVREMRALVNAGRVPAPTLRSAAVTAMACTYTAAPDAYEDYPLNCISHARAAAVCAALGKRLPTEAEWEFAAGDRDQEKRYPWGADTSACDFAIVGRGRTEAEVGDAPLTDRSSACRGGADSAPLPWGPRPVAESKDVTALGLRHMGGNMSEWVSDAAGPYDGPCGAGPRILVDPRCDVDQGLGFVHRGGDWGSQGVFAQVTLRGAAQEDASLSYVGFRCARD